MAPVRTTHQPRSVERLSLPGRLLGSFLVTPSRNRLDVELCNNDLDPRLTPAGAECAEQGTISHAIQLRFTAIACLRAADVRREE